MCATYPRKTFSFNTEFLISIALKWEINQIWVLSFTLAFKMLNTIKIYTALASDVIIGLYSSTQPFLEMSQI